MSTAPSSVSTPWCTRPLEPVYPVVFIDAIFVEIREE
jgi:putative transposase